MKRTCEPELLDSLPFDHPDAAHSRRDLRIVNVFMRSNAWFRRTLPGVVRDGETVLELGAGTGELGVDLNSRGTPVDGLDLWPRPATWPMARSWYQADLKGFSGYGAYPVIMGNLIFHQFRDDELAELGALVRKSARVIIANEPQRRRLSQTVMAAVGPLLGANHVTLHDGKISIAAGFIEDELPRALGLGADEWDCMCSCTAPGAMRMVAVRRS
ncbi:MAG TPA: hypothetical protein VFE25_03940 [Opitutaceae bacterium]|jgi:hypothetical protein|nr:hypothetical protein [Opitutaceae bacterium]